MSIPHTLSVTLHRFIVRTDRGLTDLALNTNNCVLTDESGWRCTYYGRDYTSNIFVASKLPYYALVAMSFSKDKPFDEYKADYEVIFGASVVLEGFTLINWVEKFYPPNYNISLEKLQDILLTNNKTDAFVEAVTKKPRAKKAVPPKIGSYCSRRDLDYDEPYNKLHPLVKIGIDGGDNPSVNMDQKKISLLAITPYPTETRCVIEVFATGKLNVAGIPNMEFFNKRLVPYINNTLDLMLRDSSNDYDDNKINTIRDEFIF
jgi:hypothetical protein